MKLNLGCGSNKIAGCINIDANPDVKPDQVLDFRERLPYDDSSVDEVYLFHTIEHIEKKYHVGLFKEIRRVLKSEGIFTLAYPEFKRILENWLTNKNDNRQFWEATIYGRQLYPADYHVSAMDSLELSEVLKVVGFKGVRTYQEAIEDFNSITTCRKGEPMMNYEQVLYNEIFKEN